MIPLSHYLIVSALLFAIGSAGVFLRKNLITVLLSIEIMLNAVNLSFVAFGRYNGDVTGQIITFFVMTVAAAEAAVGLALVIALFRHRESDSGILIPIYIYSTELPTYIKLLNFIDCREGDPAKLREACKHILSHLN